MMRLHGNGVLFCQWLGNEGPSRPVLILKPSCAVTLLYLTQAEVTSCSLWPQSQVKTFKDAQ